MKLLENLRMMFGNENEHVKQSQSKIQTPFEPSPFSEEELKRYLNAMQRVAKDYKFKDNIRGISFYAGNINDPNWVIDKLKQPKSTVKQFFGFTGDGNSSHNQWFNKRNRASLRLSYEVYARRGANIKGLGEYIEWMTEMDLEDAVEAYKETK